jgi:endothelin-converting enzyme
MNKASWLSPDSKPATTEKIEHLSIYVGLPQKIRRAGELDKYYEDLILDTDEFVTALEVLKNFDAQTNQEIFAGTRYDVISPWPSVFWDPSSYDSWLTGINAFYYPPGNFFTIPETISQDPFFSLLHPSALNFGGLGSVIGHEISHGFDPQGSYYNWNGTFLPSGIWDEQTRADYDDVISCFINQYDSYEVAPGVFVDGNRTKTENVADNGGLSASYMAWQTWRHNYPDSSFKLPGVDLTDEQMFFLGWGLAWCQASAPYAYYGWTDVHSPNPARVWGAVSNMEAFSDAFQCKAGSKMNRGADRCVLWG